MKLPVKLAEKRFKLIRHIASGGEGDVYLARDYKTNRDVAVKLSKTHHSYDHEVGGYGGLAGISGIPEIYWAGQDRKYYIMAIELLGPSLRDLFHYCTDRFTLKTVLLLADQLICRLRGLHSRSYVHRDVKPENLLMGTRGNKNTVFLADFGLLRKYDNTRGDYEVLKQETYHRYQCGKHPEKGVRLVGTEIYASWRAHYSTRIEQRPRDDMESLGYVLIRFLNGCLPWETIEVPNNTKRQIAMAKMKRDISVSMLCKDLPSEFGRYFRHLRMSARPDHAYLQENFRKLFLRKGFENDQDYDWHWKKEDDELLNQLRQYERGRDKRRYLMGG
ncbi:kinase-like domain-containing protein [Aspergillus alliaceus]|uniref:non-specific serine/threonine protein kinase n=1 Tax=Petromyces alliaceus TaxID=209559 RepID=A0A5N6FHL9_PETAA|nr:kinase-like domain-containing protein [Aspergillus alliaceus]KAB8229107.1 kinase-like domain-containing protein [Aspergillus alliaceus]KAE8394067.1 kinase-like domain-containing protein [Aspergillus alliaceus]